MLGACWFSGFLARARSREGFLSGFCWLFWFEIYIIDGYEC